MDVTAAVAESARVFGLTLKEKQLEAIGIQYQQAMESPLQDVSGISSNSFLQFHRNQAKFAWNVSVYIVRSLSLKTNYRSRNSRTSETKRIRELDQTLSFSSYWVKGLPARLSPSHLVWRCRPFTLY